MPFPHSIIREDGWADAQLPPSEYPYCTPKALSAKTPLLPAPRRRQTTPTRARTCDPRPYERRFQPFTRPPHTPLRDRARSDLIPSVAAVGAQLDGDALGGDAPQRLMDRGLVEEVHLGERRSNRVGRLACVLRRCNEGGGKMPSATDVQGTCYGRVQGTSEVHVCCVCVLWGMRARSAGSSSPHDERRGSSQSCGGGGRGSARMAGRSW